MNKRSTWIFLTLAVACFLFGSTPVMAAKKRVWGKTIVTKVSKSSPLTISARFSGWKQYLNVSFKGVASTKAISYELIYTSNGIDQQAGGMLNVNEGNMTKQLFLGTCSHNACVAHKNVSNVRLAVTYQALDGKSVTKNYKVKY